MIQIKLSLWLIYLYYYASKTENRVKGSSRSVKVDMDKGDKMSPISDFGKPTRKGVYNECRPEYIIMMQSFKNLILGSNEKFMCRRATAHIHP